MSFGAIDYELTMGMPHPTTVRNDRDLLWDGCVNARDLGGLGEIRPGAVVRMEAPTRERGRLGDAWVYSERSQCAA